MKAAPNPLLLEQWLILLRFLSKSALPADVKLRRDILLKLISIESNPYRNAWAIIKSSSPAYRRSPAPSPRPMWVSTQPLQLYQKELIRISSLRAVRLVPSVAASFQVCKNLWKLQVLRNHSPSQMVLPPCHVMEILWVLVHFQNAIGKWDHELFIPKTFVILLWWFRNSVCVLGMRSRTWQSVAKHIVARCFFPPLLT